MQETSKPFLKRYGIEKNRIAEMVNFFTKPLFKNAQNQSHKGGSLEARKPLNKNECFTPLNNYLDFKGLNFVGSIDFSIPFLLESMKHN